MQRLQPSNSSVQKTEQKWGAVWTLPGEASIFQVNHNFAQSLNSKASCRGKGPLHWSAPDEVCLMIEVQNNVANLKDDLSRKNITKKTERKYMMIKSKWAACSVDSTDEQSLSSIYGQHLQLMCIRQSPLITYTTGKYSTGLQTKSMAYCYKTWQMCFPMLSLCTYIIMSGVGG